MFVRFQCDPFHVGFEGYNFHGQKVIEQNCRMNHLLMYNETIRPQDKLIMRYLGIDETMGISKVIIRYQPFRIPQQVSCDNFRVFDTLQELMEFEIETIERKQQIQN